MFKSKLIMYINFYRFEYRVGKTNLGQPPSHHPHPHTPHQVHQQSSFQHHMRPRYWSTFDIYNRTGISLTSPFLIIYYH